MRFKPTEIVSILVAGIAFLGAALSAFYTYTSRNRELDIELVKVGIGVLRADPKEAQTQGAREWAIALIERHSGQRFSDSAKQELLNHRLEWFYLGTFVDDPEPPPQKREPPAAPKSLR